MEKHNAHTNDTIMELELERDVIEQFTQVVNLSDFFTWLKRCNECIEELEHPNNKRRRLTVGNQQSLVVRIARLVSLRVQLEKKFIHSGGGGGGEYVANTNTNRLVWREIDTAFQSRIITGAVINANYIEPLRFLKDAASLVLEHVKHILERHNCVKVNTIFNGEFVTNDKRANKSVNTRNCELFRSTNLEEWYDRSIVETILASLDEFQERDSGWALSRILNLIVNINKCNPMRAGCNLKLPQDIALKKAVISVQGMDNACFAHAVIAALYPAKQNSHRLSSYPNYETVLNLQGIEFPITFKHIKKFENLNCISINVYTIEENGKKGHSILPTYLTDDKKSKHVNLLYMQNPQDSKTGHFAWIKNMSRLVGAQLNKMKSRKHICDR